MDQSSVDFLKARLSTPGPSGFEAAPASVWRTEASRFADHVVADVSGNSMATLTGAKGGPVVMLAGHIDEIGLMVLNIDENGYLWFDTIGGWDEQVLVGQRVVLLGRGGPVRGVVGKKAIHLMEAAERIRVGDAGVIDSSVLEFPNGRWVSRSIDNRIGAFVVLEALRRLAQDRPVATVTAVATAQEEIAYTGGGARTSATTLVPTVAIAVDVTHATDTPGIENNRHGDVKLGGGPVLSRGSSANPRVVDLLALVAAAEGIPFAWHASPKYTATDADAIFTSFRGVATGLVSVPNRYMHSPNEMIVLEDLDRTAALLAGFVRRVTTDTSFIP